MTRSASSSKPSLLLQPTTSHAGGRARAETSPLAGATAAYARDLSVGVVLDATASVRWDFHDHTIASLREQYGQPGLEAGRAIAAMPQLQEVRHPLGWVQIAGSGYRSRVSEAVIASVPSGHVYVRHVAPETGGPTRLPDPDPEEPQRSAVEVWWPPVMLEPSWAAEAAYDVFHLQFGFDAAPVEQLRELMATVQSRGRPFVYTVHDLRNPHHRDRTQHDQQLDVLIPGADAVVTLTPGAAAEIEARWGRRPLVIPHPHVVDFRTMAIAQDCRARRRSGEFRVGLHVKSLRASMDPLRLLPDLVAAVDSLPGAVLEVNGHHDVLGDDGARRDVQLTRYLRAQERAGALRLRVHDYLSDWDLWCYLGSLDVSVLPYRFGTHSGWLEACRDLGTTVVAPTCGYFAEQGPVLTYVHDEISYDPDSLVAALVEAYETRPRFGVGISERREQRRRIAQAHERLYGALLRDEDVSCASA